MTKIIESDPQPDFLTLVKEVRRQSLLASSVVNSEDEIWENNSDVDHWDCGIVFLKL